ncbi:MAG: vanadium-dependent haloperoxidase [Verrucomicrobiaceae bacterium]|nr:vanadium-dependent haloperoxidase [Verrucomicrobiaceae bacterium]
MNIRTILIALVAVVAPLTGSYGQSVARIWNEELLDAIRRDVPNPPGHARNLHHAAMAMYNAWAAYSTTAVGYQFNEKISPLPVDIELARHEAISYAAYRVLRSRFAASVGAGTTLPSLDATLTGLGYSTSFGQGAVTSGTTPAEVGRRIGQMVLNWGPTDGFSNTTHPQAYTSSVNPNMSVPMSVLGTNVNFQPNMPLGYGIPSGTDPNLWQPLDLSTGVTQNGIPIPGGAQSFVGVQGLSTKAFSLTRPSNLLPWIDIGPPSKLSTPGNPSSTDALYKAGGIDVLQKSAVLNDTGTIDISPASWGNNPIGTESGTGYATNPVTGGTYTANNVPKGDFYRVLAEYWADGPHSETPPGHWHVIANQVADMPGFSKRLRGTGPVVNDLEWDVKTYMSLAGSVHDAACAAWSLKRYYSGTRPITMIRHMCTKGQSSNPSGPSYHTEGIPLQTDVVEVITAATAGSGGKHQSIWSVALNSYQPGTNYIGQIAVKSWPGEHPNNPPASSGLPATNQSTVRWMLGRDWLPFQRKTFNTPAFPGYISGHSTFSRAAAESLALITGSPYFPGGFHHHTYLANTMQIDLGPSVDIDLQWASYYDAADQAGASRRYGGIHPVEDDLPARIVGSTAGITAFTKAEKFWLGTIQSETVIPLVTIQSNGNALITWTQTLGRYYKLQESTNFSTWTDSAERIFATSTSGSFTDIAPAAGIAYRIIPCTTPGPLITAPQSASYKTRKSAPCLAI